MSDVLKQELESVIRSCSDSDDMFVDYIAANNIADAILKRWVLVEIKSKSQLRRIESQRKQEDR